MEIEPNECEILRQKAAKYDRLQEILLAYDNNDITNHPWWAIVRPVEERKTHRVIYEVLAGPFFSRERAEKKRESRLYHYGEKSLVYCFSGHESAHYSEIREIIGARQHDHEIYEKRSAASRQAAGLLADKEIG